MCEQVDQHIHCLVSIHEITNSAEGDILMGKNKSFFPDLEVYLNIAIFIDVESEGVQMIC
jgi:hypothetical protein